MEVKDCGIEGYESESIKCMVEIGLRTIVFSKWEFGKVIYLQNNYSGYILLSDA